MFDNPLRVPLDGFDGAGIMSSLRGNNVVKRTPGVEGTSEAVF